MLETPMRAAAAEFIGACALTFMGAGPPGSGTRGPVLGGGVAAVIYSWLYLGARSELIGTAEPA
jgi:hypothetical protein